MSEEQGLKQITVFLENRSGRLAAICNALGEAGVNILALSLADTADFGILRLVVSDTEKGIQTFKAKGFATSVTHVVPVGVPDRPGGLGHVLTILERAGVNVEYLYPFAAGREGCAPIAFRFDNTSEAVRALRQAGIAVPLKVATGSTKG